MFMSTANGQYTCRHFKVPLDPEWIVAQPLTDYDHPADQLRNLWILEHRPSLEHIWTGHASMGTDWYTVGTNAPVLLCSSRALVLGRGAPWHCTQYTFRQCNLLSRVCSIFVDHERGSITYRRHSCLFQMLGYTVVRLLHGKRSMFTQKGQTF